jgi:hypothetical protein
MVLERASDRLPSRFVFFNNGKNFADLTTQSWAGPQWWGGNNDLAFTAEPETYALLIAGLGVVGAVARRRMQKSA